MSKAAYQLNKEIESFVLGKKTPYTQEEIAYVNQYKGYGGMWKYDAELQAKRGLYEYYTPVPIVEAMVGLAHKHGYRSGPVLEPSCGVGRFLHYFSPKEEVWGVEVDRVSARIAEANFPEFTIWNMTFNELFVDRRGNERSPAAWKERFALVIGNPPYGDFTGKFTAQEKLITGAANYVEYFIYRGLMCLRPGALLIYIIPRSFMDSPTSKAKDGIARMAELIDAYRLPGGMFEQTDIQTDIVVFKKTTHGK